MKPTLVLDSIETYKRSSLERLKWQIKEFFENHTEVEVSHMLETIEDLNAYENLEHLKPLSEEHVILLDEDKLDESIAEKAVLNGDVFWEHHAAGEATRLGLGTKYLLYLNELSVEKIREMMKKEAEKDGKELQLTEKEIEEKIGCKPEKTLPINLGTRHMLQLAFDIKRLAEKHGEKPEKALKRQHMLIVLNETTADKIIKEWEEHDHFGFDKEKIYFMVQKSFPGIEIEKGEPRYDETHENHKRLHNHGQLKMQTTHDDEIFTYDGERKYIKSEEFEQVLSKKKDLLTLSIEDINYLTSSIDYHCLALALELGRQGYEMVMELVGQNPLRPQKGGACFYDEKKGRPVLIESNQLKGIKPKDITHLNKNFNHYPNPVKAYQALKSGEMELHTCVKRSEDKEGKEKDYVYFCTPQGDINFLVKTAYVKRKVLKPIANWKSPATTPPTVKACREQDQQEGFKEFAGRVLKKEFKNSEQV